METKVTSKNTSVNKRVPAVFGLIEKNTDTRLLRRYGLYDYGCGKYPEYAGKWAEEREIPYTGQDPYNHEKEYYNKIYAYRSRWFAVSSNVLNVLPETQRIDYLEDILEDYPAGMFITVYEGNKSGIGKYRKDSYQANMKTAEMLEWLIKIFPQYRWGRRGKLIFVMMGAKL